MLSTEFGTSKGENIYNKVIFEGEVIDLLDANENGVFKVRIPELDRDILDSDLPLCYPMFNFTFFKVLPKKGERVTLILRNQYSTDLLYNKDVRYWISIVQNNIVDRDFQRFQEANTHFGDSASVKTKSYKNIPKAKGLIPEYDDIVINSRDNSKIILKKDQLFLIAGEHLNGLFEFNKTNPSYITILHDNGKQNISDPKININEIQVITKSTYTIIVSEPSNSTLLISVVDVIGNEVDSLSIEDTIRDTRLYNAELEIDLFKQKYVDWKFETNIPELQYLPSTNNNNTSSVFQKSINKSETKIGSNIMLVSDVISLISHKNNKFDVKQQPSYFNNETLLKVNNEGEPIPYGNKLVDLLNLMRTVIVNHVHPYHGMKANEENVVQQLLSFDLESILNQNIITG